MKLVIYFFCIVSIQFIIKTNQNYLKNKISQQDQSQKKDLKQKNNFRLKQNQNIPGNNSGDDCVSIEGWLKIKTKSFKQDPQLPKQQDQNSLSTQKEFLQNLKFEELQNQNSSEKIPEQEAFYFRKIGNKLLFTQNINPDGNPILAAIDFTIIEPEGQYCFQVSNETPELPWTLCTLNNGALNQWLSDLNKSKGYSSSSKISNQSLMNQNQIILPVSNADCSNDWDYMQNGKNWICKCNQGKQQSPVDLPSTKCLDSMKQSPIFDYPKVMADKIFFQQKKNILKIKPLGQINLGSLIDLEGNVYQVSEIQFHSPSEHYIHGKQFDLEVQVIHKAISGDQNKQAILSILYEVQDGYKHPFFQNLDPIQLPSAEQMVLAVQNQKKKDTSTNLWNKDFFTVYSLLYNDDQIDSPPPFSFYQYQGSLTQPPCDEKVLWIIVSTPQNIGSTILSFIKESLKDKKSNQEEDTPKEIPQKSLDISDKSSQLFKGNHRLIQKLNERQIQYYDKNCPCCSKKDLNQQKEEYFKKLQQKTNNNQDSAQISNVKAGDSVRNCLNLQKKTAST